MAGSGELRMMKRYVKGYINAVICHQERKRDPTEKALPESSEVYSATFFKISAGKLSINPCGTATRRNDLIAGSMGVAVQFLLL